MIGLYGKLKVKKQKLIISREREKKSLCSIIQRIYDKIITLIATKGNVKIQKYLYIVFPFPFNFISLIYRKIYGEPSPLI